MAKNRKSITILVPTNKEIKANWVNIYLCRASFLLRIKRKIWQLLLCVTGRPLYMEAWLYTLRQQRKINCILLLLIQLCSQVRGAFHGYKLRQYVCLDRN